MLGLGNGTTHRTPYDRERRDVGLNPRASCERFNRRRVIRVAGVGPRRSLDVRSDTLCPMSARKFWYSWGTMSALNGDKARFNRERRAKLARRERSQAIRRKLKDPTLPREAGTQL